MQSYINAKRLYTYKQLASAISIEIYKICNMSHRGEKKKIEQHITSLINDHNIE